MKRLLHFRERNCRLCVCVCRMTVHDEYRWHAIEILFQFSFSPAARSRQVCLILRLEGRKSSTNDHLSYVFVQQQKKNRIFSPKKIIKWKEKFRLGERPVVVVCCYDSLKALGFFFFSMRWAHSGWRRVSNQKAAMGKLKNINHFSSRPHTSPPHLNT